MLARGFHFDSVAWPIFIGSAVLLLIVLLRTKSMLRWFGYIGFNIILGVSALLLLQHYGQAVHMSIPLNTVTVLTIGVLGIPGLLLLTAIQMTLM